MDDVREHLFNSTLEKVAKEREGSASLDELEERYGDVEAEEPSEGAQPADNNAAEHEEYMMSQDALDMQIDEFHLMELEREAEEASAEKQVDSVPDHSHALMDRAFGHGIELERGSGDDSQAEPVKMGQEEEEDAIPSSFSSSILVPSSIAEGVDNDSIHDGDDRGSQTSDSPSKRQRVK
jgi:hypothetical protein